MRLLLEFYPCPQFHVLRTKLKKNKIENIANKLIPFFQDVVREVRDFVKGLKIPRINIHPSVIQKLKIPLDTFARNELARVRPNAIADARAGDPRGSFQRNTNAGTREPDSRTNIGSARARGASYGAHKGAREKEPRDEARGNFGGVEKKRGNFDRNEKARRNADGNETRNRGGRNGETNQSKENTQHRNEEKSEKEKVQSKEGENMVKRPRWT